MRTLLHYTLVLFFALTAAVSAEEKPATPAASTDAKPDIVRAPRTAEGWHGQIGKTLHFVATGAAGKNLWGTDIYPTFSEIAPVTVHAGVLKEGETAVVKVTIVKGVDSPASTRNGITSQHWTGYDTDCYKVERTNLPVPDLPTPTPTITPPPTPFPSPDINASAKEPGKTFSFKLRGSLRGNLYGTDVYTIDSDLAAAAVHAGVLKDGEEGMVKVTIMPPAGSHKATTQNGVTSSAWNAVGSCFKIEKAK